MSKYNFKKIGEESMPLVRAVKDGDNDSYEKLLKAYDPIINYVISKVWGSGKVDKEDLYQEASIALWQACLNYKEGKGNFYPYFVAAATNNLVKYAWMTQSSLSMVHFHNLTDDFKRAWVLGGEFYNKNGFGPTEAFFESRGIPKKDIDTYFRVISSIFDDLDADEYSDKVADNTTENDYMEKDMVRSYVNRLPDKLKQVIEMKSFQGLTYNEISAITGDKISILSYRYTQALTKLKEMMEEDGITY